MFVTNVHVNQEMASSDVSLPSVSDWEVSEISLFWQADWLMLWNVSPSVSFARFQVYLQCWCSNREKHTWSEKQECWVNLSSASKPDHQRISMCSLPLWSAQSTCWMLPGFPMSFSHSLLLWNDMGWSVPFSLLQTLLQPKNNTSLSHGFSSGWSKNMQSLQSGFYITKYTRPITFLQVPWLGNGFLKLKLPPLWKFIENSGLKQKQKFCAMLLSMIEKICLSKKSWGFIGTLNS